MPDRAAYIGIDQIDHLSGSRGETGDAHLHIHKDHAHPGASQQIVHIVIRARQFGNPGLQLSIDGCQLFIDRLQLFFGGFQFLVGGLEFFVDRLQFFVGGF